MTSKKEKTPPQQLHEPVLLKQVLEVLSPKPGETYLDLTAGYGGHASAIIRKIGNPRNATLVDRDEFAISQLEPLKDAGAELVHMDFATAAADLVDQEKRFDIVLVDLGVSSPQLDNAERGFSILRPGPLDMRMDQSQKLTAGKVVNAYPVQRLVKILREYGDEPKAHNIAQAIARARPLRTTEELADVILKTHRGRWQRFHLATHTFQAIRIGVNDKIGEIT